MISGQVDFKPMYVMLENLDKRIKQSGDVRGIMSLTREKVWQAIYEFAVIAIEFDKADCMQRIETLNAKNLEMFIKNENLIATNTELYKRLLKYEDAEGISISEEGWYRDWETFQGS